MPTSESQFSSSKEALLIAELARARVEIHRLRERLEASEARYRAIGESIPYGIWVSSLAGDMSYLSDSFLKLIGMKLEECRQFGWAKALLPEDIETMLNDWRICTQAGGNWDYEYRVRGVDGEVRTVLSRGVPTRDREGNLTGYAGLHLDITDRKRIEEELGKTADALLRSEEKYDLAIKGSHVGIWELFPDSGEMYLSPTSKKIIGYKEDEIDNSLKSWESRLHPEDLHSAREQIAVYWENLKTTDFDEIPFFEQEFRVRHKNGNYRWVISRGMAYLNPKGVPYKMAGTHIDITDHKEAEEKLQCLSEELSRSNRELEQFSYVASHDLQEPLRKIVAFSDKLSGADSGFGETERDYLARMQSAAGRMKKLIEDLLHFSRVTLKPKAFEVVDLNETLREVLCDLETRIAETQASIEVGELPVIEANPSQMKQLFQNLIANALKFRRKDVLPRIVIENRGLDESHTEITVHDNGIGFDEKYAERIFKPFQRLHARHEFEGSGIGLAICQKIVAQHKGEITAKSRPGEGAVFIIRLPIKQGGHDTQKLGTR